MSAAVLGRNGKTALLAIVTYALALGGAVLTGSDIGGLNAGVEGVSSSAGATLGGLAAALPLGFAFGAGMVAAVNPCGFALLPAYVALYLGAREGEAPPPSGAIRIARGVRIGLTVTAGFTLLFGMTGLLLSVMATVLLRVFPWLGLAIGVVLIALGARLAGGAPVYAGFGERVADRLGERARQSSGSGYFLYGLAYGAASLSCTLPIFMAVVGSAFASLDYVAAAMPFVLYALGMGSVVVGVTLAIAAFREAVTIRARAVLRHMQSASAMLLLLAGAYVTYYWLTLGGLLSALHVA